MNKPARITFEPIAEPYFTVRDYTRLMESDAFTDVKVELVAGELRKMMPAGYSHGELNGDLYGDLRAVYRPLGFGLAIDLAIVIDASTVRGADVAVVMGDVPSTGPVPADRIVLVVEVSGTTLGRDLGEKQADYARAGIPDYWVADLDAKVMHVMRAPDGNRYAERRVVPFSEPIAIPGTDRTLVVG